MNIIQHSYKLNADVEFVFPCNELRRFDGEIPPIKLMTPASRCLFMLINKKGIVTQKELYEFGWSNFGSNATPNNLYQNIFNLRKALSTILKGTKKTIITVPREGFYLHPSIKISTITDISSETESSPTNVERSDIAILSDSVNRISSELHTISDKIRELQSLVTPKCE